MTEEGTMPNTSNGEGNVFARSGKLRRSPVPVIGSNKTLGEEQELHGGFGLAQMFTPKSSKQTTQGVQPGRNNMVEVRKRVNELYDFVKEKNNVHTKLVTSIRSAVTTAEREHEELKQRTEVTEMALAAATETADEVQDTPMEPLRSEKRKRDTPGEEEEQKKPKNDKGDMEQQGENSGWRTVENQKVKKKTQKEEKKKEGVEKGKPKPRRERTKGDALVVEAKEGMSYAQLLRKIRDDPELQKLGENVVKTRRTQKGEMLFELKKRSGSQKLCFQGVG